MLNLKKINKFELLYLFIFIILSTGVLLWFKTPNSLISAGDLSWPLDFGQFLKATFYSWDDKTNFGYLATRQNASFFPFAVYGFILQSLSLTPHYIQVIIFYSSFLASCLGTYFFLRKLTGNNFGSFLGGIYYSLNPYALSVAWNPTYGFTFPFYTWIPTALFFLLKLLQSQKLYQIFFYSLIIECLPIGFSYSNPVFFMVFLALSVFIFFLVYFQTAFAKSVVKNFLIFVFLYFIFNIFWLAPFITNIHYEFTSASNAPAELFSDADTLSLNSINLADTFRASGFWALESGSFADNYYDWRYDLSNPNKIGAEYFPLLLVLFFLLFKNRKDKSIVLVFFLLLYVLAILINSAYLKGGIYEKLMQFIFINDFIIRSFRSIFIKLGILLVLSLSVLLAETVRVKKLNLNLNLVNTVIILLISWTSIIALGKPFALGQVMKSSGNLLPGYSVTIPEEYIKFSVFAKTHLKEGRVLSLPLPKSYNVVLNWGNKNGYIGADFLKFYLNQPLIYVNFNTGIMNKFVQNILTNRNSDIFFSLLNIRYIFQRKDTIPEALDGYLVEEIPDYRQLYSKIYSTKYFDLYELKEEYYRPQIYSPSNFELVNNIEATSFADFVPDTAILENTEAIRNITEKLDSRSLLDQKIKYQKISPTLYKVVLTTSADRIPIVFSDAFNNGWDITVKNGIFNRTLTTLQKKHFIVNGYANLWFLDKTDFCTDGSNCEFFIEYLPQRVFISSLTLSAGLFFISIIYCLIIFIGKSEKFESNKNS